MTRCACTQDTLIAAKSGFHCVMGETVYMHTNGGFYRVKAGKREGVECPCGAAHDC